MPDLESKSYAELPPAMVNYLAARLTKVGKHAGGHRGQRAKAHMRRHGTWGKASRHRRLAANRAQISSCRATLAPSGSSEEDAA